MVALYIKYIDADHRMANWTLMYFKILGHLTGQLYRVQVSYKFIIKKYSLAANSFEKKNSSRYIKPPEDIQIDFTTFMQLIFFYRGSWGTHLL